MPKLKEAITERTKAIIIVDNGLAYNNDAVELCLIKGKYMEVED